MTRRQLALAAGALTLVLAAGCSTTTKGKGIGPAFTNVAGLGAQISHSSVKLKSAQGTLNVDAGPLKQTSTFRQQMSGGQITAFDDRIDTTLQGKETKIHLIYVDETIYIDRGQNGKPWIVATPDSSDPIAAELAKTFPQALAQSSVKYYAIMLSAAHDLTVAGADTVDGVDTIHYKVTVDPQALLDKLPPDQTQQMQQAVDAGVDAIPVEYWVDGQGRIVKFTDEVSAQGQTAHVEMRLNHYDEDITIDAPPANQIDQD